MPKIFISHASADKVVIDGFVDVIQSGGNISVDDIFCSSVDGCEIDTGEKFIEVIVSKLTAADLVILMLSPNFYASSFCLAEMGAAWAIATQVFPFVFAGAPRDPGVVFSKLKSQLLDDAGLDALHERLVDDGFMDRARTKRWNAKKAIFLGKLQGLLAAVPEPAIVRREELAAVEGREAGAIELLEEAEDKLRSLQQKYDDLKKLKNAEAVREVELAHSGLRERYDAVLGTVKESLTDLDDAVVRIVFSSNAGNPWLPQRDSDIERQINAALERGQIEKADSSDGFLGFRANRRHPAIKRALTSLQELQAVLDDDEAGDLSDELSEDFDGIVSVDNREFFEHAIVHRRLED